MRQIIQIVLALVQSYELIALFWGGALLIWVELRIQGINARSAAARLWLQRLASYFLTSVAFLSIAVLIDYAITQTSPVLSIFYENQAFLTLEAICVAIGIATLATGLIGVQKVGGKRKTVVLPTITIAVGIGLAALVNSLALITFAAQGAIFQSIAGIVAICFFLISYFGIPLSMWYPDRLHGWGAAGGIVVMFSPWGYLFVLLILGLLGVRLP
ncbi:MAG: hypothetical protein ABSC50_12790 [Candidatus Bathyarchaeia archaeon]